MFWSPVRSYLQVFLSLYRVNREISKVCLQIVFVCGSETGFPAWVRKIHVGKCLFQSRTGLLILFLSSATFIWGIPENKYELWGYIKSNINVRKTPASRTMNRKLCWNFLARILLASDWFKDNQLLSQLTHAHYRDTAPLNVGSELSERASFQILPLRRVYGWNVTFSSSSFLAIVQYNLFPRSSAA